VSTITQEKAGQQVALEQIRVPDNVRALNQAHVEALAGSIDLQGMLVPVVVCPDGEGFELVAGFHRMAAARSLGLAAVPVVVRDAETEDADRAVENITRKQLNPYEEAKAVHAMLGRGLTEDGAAQALGWPKTRVTARVKILELPERAQQLIGEGVIALSAVDQLRAIGSVAPALLDAVIAYLDDGNAWAAERLAREPGWVLDAAMRETGDKTFAAYLDSASSHAIADLRLGKKAEALYAEAEKLYRQLDRYAYGPPAIRFTEADVDQARAAGVLIEFERGRPIIVDRSVYRELVKGAIMRTHDELETKAAAAADERKAARSSKAPADLLTAAKRDRDAQLRELADQAHGANLDLGASLMTGLAAVDPGDIDVARFFVLCRRSHSTNYADRLTMRIIRCRTRGNDDEDGPGAANARSGRACGEEDGLRRASKDRLHAGARLLTLGDLGRRSSLPRWPRWRVQCRGRARNGRRSSSQRAAARRCCGSSDSGVFSAPAATLAPRAKRERAGHAVSARLGATRLEHRSPQAFLVAAAR
jgi:ParB/RepB/Spo0J family partition protein